MTSKGVGIETLLNPEMGSKRLIVERLTIEEGKSYRRVAEGEEGFYYVAGRLSSTKTPQDGSFQQTPTTSSGYL